MKVLWMSNAPWSTSAYAAQTRMHVPRLRAMGHEMALFPFYGLQGGPLRYDGMMCYPSGLDAWGMDIVDAHAQHFGADVVICNMDSWKVQPDAFTTPYVVRFPVDMQPLSQPIHRSIAPALTRIVESRFGERMVLDAGLDCVYVPACIDTTVFKPIDRIEARKTLGLPEDKFIVGMVATNRGGEPTRKGFEPALRGFAQFQREVCPDSLLYLHCLTGEDGTHGAAHLLNLIEMEGLSTPVIFGPQYDIIAGHIADSQMALLYSAFDVLLCASLGEGVCVPLLEAQACGTPVIAPAWTATDEIVFAGWKLSDYEPYPFSQFKAYQFMPRGCEIAERLTDAYEGLQSPETRAHLSARAVEGAARYDADYVAEYYWPAALAQIEERLAALRAPITPTAEQCMKCPINSKGPWAAMGWMDGKGSMYTPCMFADCAHAVRTDMRTRQHTFAPDAFPMVVDGLALDIEDTPPGAVAKIVAREAEANYKLHLMEFKPGDVVIDIGAHVGVMSVYLAKKWPEAVVIAYEPHPGNFARLKRNIEANGCRNIAVKHAAVTGDGRSIMLVGDYAANTGGLGICNTPVDGVTYQEVKSVTLCDIFKSLGALQMLELMPERIALLKIDCEGAEFEILASAAEQGLLDKIDRIVGEIHIHEGEQQRAQDLIRLLKVHISYVDMGVCKV